MGIVVTKIKSSRAGNYYCKGSCIKLSDTFAVVKQLLKSIHHNNRYTSCNTTCGN